MVVLLTKESDTVAQTVTNVTGPSNGTYSGKAGSYGNITFGQIKEPAAWRTGNQQQYHSQRYWWVKSSENRGKVFIVREQPRQGQDLDLSNVVAKHDEDYLTY